MDMSDSDRKNHLWFAIRSDGIIYHCFINFKDYDNHYQNFNQYFPQASGSSGA